MPCEIVLFSVWTRKDGVIVFSASTEAVDHRMQALNGGSDVPDNVSKVKRHLITIEDAERKEGR